MVTAMKFWFAKALVEFLITAIILLVIFSPLWLGAIADNLKKWRKK